MRGLIQSSVVLTAALCGFLLGCGGNQEATSSNAADKQPLTKAEFIEKGEAICKRTDELQNEWASRYSETHAKELERLSPVAAEEKLIVLFVLPQIQREARELKALGAPPGEAKKVDGFVTGIEAGLRQVRKHPYTIETNLGVESPFHPVDVLFFEYGFDECSNPT